VQDGQEGKNIDVDSFSNTWTVDDTETGEEMKIFPYLK
jgi:hypothetical protein